MGGKIGVNIFVIISGYYLINDNGKVFNIYKIAKFVGQVIFYSIVMFMIMNFNHIGDLSIKSFVQALFPITYEQWWFASTYFVLFLMHPFLNILLKNLDKNMYQKFLFVLIICWSVIPTITNSSYQSNSLLWFVTLYSIAGYIRLYGLNDKYTIKHYVILLILSVTVTYASSVVFAVLGMKWSFFSSHDTYFYDQEKITMQLISLCLFMIFVNLNINYCKWINTAASATFGVYLIHDHSSIRRFLWMDLFQNAKYQETMLLIPYSIFVVLVVYVVCTLIDLLRQQMIEKPCMILLKRYSEK